MYEELLGFHSCNNFPLMLLGDFNEVLDIRDRLGMSCIGPSIREFKGCINHMNLIEMDLHDMRYT